MGNKKKLVKKGLVKLFPKEIDAMYELFGGSAIISMNTYKVNKYYINDCDNYLYRLYELFKIEDSKRIINHINKRVEEFTLPKERTRRCDFDDQELLEQYKKSYATFRNIANENNNIMDLYTLMFFAFSQQARFNSNGKFNMPFGTDCFSEGNKEYIENGCNFFKRENVNITNNDFRELNIDKLSNNDFVYLDPPYLNTTATYNENGGWNVNDEEDLYKLCEKLNNNNIKFGMSNVFENKGLKNEKLIAWCNENKFNVYAFDKVAYTACGKGNSNAKEVFITNYQAGVNSLPQNFL